MTKHAFKCNTCGHLEDSANAGERETPAACRTCGAGVSFDPVSGIKQYHPENWTVLADLSDDELAALPQRLERKDVAKHKPAPASDPGHEPQDITRTVTEDMSREDNLT